MRTQGLPYPEVLVRQECQVGLFCSLVGLFCQGLPYPEVLVRQEKLTYYAQLAAVSKVTALFRSVKERHVQAQARVARESAHHDQQGGGRGGGLQSRVMSAIMAMNPPPQSSRIMIACTWRL